MRFSIDHYRDVHAGATAAILGGGPSLPADLDQVPADAILYACNHHAEPLVVSHYAVWLDKNGHHRLMDTPSVTISPRPEAEVDCGGLIAERDLTGPVAARIAEFMGCARILLAGMDLYQGAQPYWHPTDRMPSGYGRRLDANVAAWRRHAARMRDASRLVAISGPLVEIFGGLGA